MRSIAASPEEVFAKSDMIVKVKEPQPTECAMLRKGQLLITYLHLAPDPVQAEGLLKSGCTAIAYETITGPGGGLPLLAPMSEVAGRMSIQAGAHCLEKEQGGSGVLLGGVPGVEAAKVVVLGGGVAVIQSVAEPGDQGLALVEGGFELADQLRVAGAVGRLCLAELERTRAHLLLQAECGVHFFLPFLLTAFDGFGCVCGHVPTGISVARAGADRLRRANRLRRGLHAVGVPY